MAKVKITSQLNRKLNNSPLSAALLIQRFSDWKDGNEYGSYWFGQDKADHKTGLSHAHMAPVSIGPDKEQWELLWKLNRPWQRRSDCYVLYAHDRWHGYLLIDVIFDPGAHKLWAAQHKQQLENYEIVADNFLFNGSVP